MLAPIVLFVYNRPDHTKRVVDALLRNKLSSESILYIFADGPKVNATKEHINKILELRSYLHTIKGFKEVVIEESDVNKGLSNSEIYGVSKVVKKHGKVIVLEDDLETSSQFLKYMNESLDLYENDEKVVCISGFSFIKNAPIKETSYFIVGCECCGWGTWKRGWDTFPLDTKPLYKEILRNKRLEKHFNYDYSYDFNGMLKQQIDGKIDSWAIRWRASVFVKELLCLHPTKSLIHNIGFDSEGTHTYNPQDEEATIEANECITEYPKIPILESSVMYKKHVEFFKRRSGGNRLKRIMKKILVYIQKVNICFLIHLCSLWIISLFCLYY